MSAPLIVAALGNWNDTVAVNDAVNERATRSRCRLHGAHVVATPAKLIAPWSFRGLSTARVSFQFPSAATIRGASTST